jgi:hypothetical protein
MSETAERDLREDLESLFALKTREYERMFFDTQEEMSELSLQVQKLKTELEAIKRREDQDVAGSRPEARPSEGGIATAERTIDHERQNSLKEERRNRHRQARKSNEARRQEIETALAKAEKRNLLSILGMLGGLATIAAGAAKT